MESHWQDPYWQILHINLLFESMHRGEADLGQICRENPGADRAFLKAYAESCIVDGFFSYDHTAEGPPLVVRPGARDDVYVWVPVDNEPLRRLTEQLRRDHGVGEGSVALPY